MRIHIFYVFCYVKASFTYLLPSAQLETDGGEFVDFLRQLSEAGEVSNYLTLY